MAMHRLPAGTEGPRWRVLVAVWAASVVLALAFAVGIQLLWHPGNPTMIFVTPTLWLAIQWAAWLYLKDRPAHPRLFELEPEPDDSPTLRLETVVAPGPVVRASPGDRIAGLALDRPEPRHALKEDLLVPIQPKPTPYARVDEPTPAQTDLSPDRFAPFTLERIEEAAFRIQWRRWNFNRLRAMPEPDARRGWKALNRYLAEQVRQEAFAALACLQTDLDEARHTAEFWDNAMLRFIGWFNPPDEDSACEQICLDAIERAYQFALSSPCQCDEGVSSEDDQFEACQRCQVLGRVRDVEVER